MPRLQRPQSNHWLKAFFAACVATTGCQLGTLHLTEKPVRYEEQVAEVLKIAPMGTERGETVRRLQAAGIDGSFGISKSIYYCKTWHREEGQRSRLDVALLFNEEGRLYETRPGDTAVTVEKSSAGPHLSNQPNSSVAGGGSNAPATTATPGNSQSSVPRSGTRSPFRDDK